MVNNKKTTPKIAAIIQARMTSARLPGKVLMDLAGEPMIGRLVERVKHSKNINDVILAISEMKASDELENFAIKSRVNYFRGSEDDVLRRYYEAAKKYGIDIIVRLTGDNPLVDPDVIDLVVDELLSSGADYVSGQKTVPLGLGAEAFRFSVLELANADAQKNYQREHVTPYIYEHPEIFKIQGLKLPKKLNRLELRLTVDTEEDLLLVRKIYEHFHGLGKMFSAEDILSLIDGRPDLARINRHIKQKKTK